MKSKILCIILLFQILNIQIIFGQEASSLTDTIDAAIEEGLTILDDMERTNTEAKAAIERLEQENADASSINEAQGVYINGLENIITEKDKIHIRQTEYVASLQQDRRFWKTFTFIGIPVSICIGFGVGVGLFYFLTK
jgi:hypothetical protein